MVYDIIRSNIFSLRGHNILFDFYLAGLYEVSTKSLKQAVRRNSERFPQDFMFELTRDEIDRIRENKRSQNVTFNWPSITYSPFAFTEQGVAMLSTVLRSDRAIEVNIEIMRAFVILRSTAINIMNFGTKSMN